MTNARLQRGMTLGGLVISWLLAVYFWPQYPGWAIMAASMPVLAVATLVAVPCGWAAYVNRTDSVLRASVLQWLQAWLAECRSAALVFMWWQPFRHRAITDQLSPTQGQRGMVLVHGYLCNRALWTQWMLQLKRQGRVFVAVDLEPAFGSIGAYAGVIDEAVRAVEAATGLPPVVVCHSMGGLAIRAWAQSVGEQGMRRVHRIFTLGTPHQGTKLAALSHTTNGQEMRQGSKWLRANALNLPASFAKQTTCFFSHCDSIVFPASTACFPGADHQHQEGLAHVQLVFAPDIQQACLAALDS
jgi:triacylglycerol lipase